MALQRLTLTRHIFSRRIQPSITQPTFSRGVKWAASDTATTAADGASDKSPENAKPTILNRSPPEGDEKSNETQKHNEEQAQRHDKPDENTKDNKKDDTVSKGFWSGTSIVATWNVGMNC